MSEHKSALNVKVVATKPFLDQKPGTSGLRKKVTVVEQPNYLENFVQSIFDSLPAAEIKGCELVVSGDGRYYNDKAVDLIIRIAAANEVGRIVVGQNFLVSTPAVSGIVRSRKSYGAIILTASHNPGGPTEDFGIKYNCSNGGPAPEALTDVMFAKSKTISQYRIVNEQPQYDTSKVGTYPFGSLEIEVIDAARAYADLMKSIFDFQALSAFIKRPDFKFVYDSMNGVAGPFAREIFVNQLGASPDSLINGTPLPDFGHGHPDPNLTYAHHLVEVMGLTSTGAPDSKAEVKGIPDFGAAADGDADRNMILGKQFFVTPSDSVAIIAANAKEAIPYFGKTGVKGVARSMPTSQALDRVAEKLGLRYFEVPTGWKFFGNLMDADMLSICGEESFGTGSDHIREKDGVWAVLAWLSILQYKNKSSASGHLVTVKDIVEDHWKTYGRNYYSRYDYEGVDAKGANELMASMVQRIEAKSLSSSDPALQISGADEFTYTDPVDRSVSAHQGIRFMFKDGSRIVFRLSGTGSVGATIRLYVEKYEADASRLNMDTQEAVAPLIKLALQLSDLQRHTGRDQPTVIT